MKETMDSTDLTLLAELQKGLPLTQHPFVTVGENLGIPEEEVITRIKNLKQEGIIRRYRARINQRLLGIEANALVAWKVRTTSPDIAGNILASMPGVTHCYQRKPVKGTWEYTHYTVHHGWSRHDVLDEITSIAEYTGFIEYLVLFSTEEYKRTPHVNVRDLVTNNE